MCSTCNHKNFEHNNGRLEQSLGNGSLLICCDVNGRNYKLAVKGEQNSNFVLYSCPTCRKRLPS